MREENENRQRGRERKGRGRNELNSGGERRRGPDKKGLKLFPQNVNARVKSEFVYQS